MTHDEHEPWPLLAYGDRLSTVAGDVLQVMVSSTRPEFRAELVRLGVPRSPAFEGRVTSAIEGTYPGRVQPLHAGSYIRTAPIPPTVGGSYTIQTWIFPTLAGTGIQTIAAQGRGGHQGWALELDEHGRLRLREWSEGVELVRVHSASRLASHSWYFVAGTIDESGSIARATLAGASPWMDARRSTTEQARSRNVSPTAGDDAVYIGACQAEAGEWGSVVFNGKIEAPRLFRAALSDAQLEQLRDGVDPATVAPGSLAGAWDMSAALDTVSVYDRSPAAAHGVCVNTPMRAVTGHRWKGQALEAERDSSLYGAIHFHDDDLDDAGWTPSLAVPITAELPSGLYAVKLTSDRDRAYVPFYVRPPAGKPTASVLLIAPTNTYLAYSNNRLAATLSDEACMPGEAPLRPVDRFVATHPALGGSLYDTHRDGSGVCYVSRLRPIPNIDPTYIDSQTNGPRHFAADVELIAWAAAEGQPIDIATDEDLHREGATLLGQYGVVMTGSHPEYYSGPMLDALTEYLEVGGNLMYLGGNGFYWVTTYHPQLPHVIEVRKGFSGTRNWQVAPGEEHHSTTGERGGLWRHRGRSAHQLVGVGAVGHAAVEGVGYRRLPESRVNRVSFIFDGVAHESFGHFGVALGAAAGDEVDATDSTLGTPANALVLARSEALAGYVPMMEDELWYRPNRTGEHNTRIRAELVYFETGHGGAVFSVGSVSWCGALGSNDYDNDVARITGNVLRKFLAVSADVSGMRS
jgi:N,N-dimethylformamidase